MKVEDHGNTVIIAFTPAEVHHDVPSQLAPLLDALAIHAGRSEQYGDNWRRKGWRGSLFQLRNAVERAWDALWAAEPVANAFERGLPEPDVDDLLDAINYAAMAVRSIRDGDRDGQWSYPNG